MQHWLRSRDLNPKPLLMRQMRFPFLHRAEGKLIYFVYFARTNLVFAREKCFTFFDLNLLAFDVERAAYR